MNLTIIILTAGRGTRMKSDLPKVLHPLAGWPMIRYVVNVAHALTPDNITLVVGHGADLVRQEVGLAATYVTQAEQRGTGHAVQQTRSAAAGQGHTVLVLYGDTPLVQSKTLQHMVEHHLATQAVATLLTFQPQDPSGYGRIVRDARTGQVQAIVEHKDATPEQRAIGEANSGILCFQDEWLWPNLSQLEQHPNNETYLTDLVAMACQQKRIVTAIPVADPIEVIGLDDRLSLAQAELEIRQRINQQWMLAGVTLIHPEATYIDMDVEIGADTTIWPNTFLQGQTRIGRKCTIGPGSVLRDSTIGDGCRVELSVVEQAVMEKDSNVGPFSHLRKGAHLGTGVHMGNFGEVKNSYLGPGVKMGHFSYLGDATVEAEANIGAGTITCNYDGQHKHHTTVGKDAFIGSGSMLVAPVEIGTGAIVGAGSVVTRDVPPDSVAYGVPARIKSTSSAQESEV